MQLRPQYTFDGRTRKADGLTTRMPLGRTALRRANPNTSQRGLHLSKPIYLLVLGKGFTEAWYQLSKQEQDTLWAKVEEIDRRAGAVWQIVCNSRWADQEIFDWGVIEYPDLDAYQAKVAQLEELQWWRYFTARTVLGTKVEED